MLKSPPPGPRNRPRRYKAVPLAELRQGRRGKHRKLLDTIIAELHHLPDAQAMKIPLATVQGIPLANLRSAVSRASKSHGVKIATFSDGENLFVWKKSANTSRYERNRARAKAHL